MVLYPLPIHEIVQIATDSFESFAVPIQWKRRMTQHEWESDSNYDGHENDGRLSFMLLLFVLNVCQHQ